MVRYHGSKTGLQQCFTFCSLMVNVAGVFCGAAGDRGPGFGQREGPASQSHQSSSGKPGWSQTRPHTATQGSRGPRRYAHLGNTKDKGKINRDKKHESMDLQNNTTLSTFLRHLLWFRYW